MGEHGETASGEGAPSSVRTVLKSPPGASPTARRWARRFVTPIESFLHVEASSGIVLLAAAGIAMAIANSSWAHAFHELLDLKVALRVGEWTAEQSVHFLINDGLMTIFFFVVGLEIRREIHQGELSTLRRATLPVAAALGGMAAPALLYLLVARPEDRAGWGVPMATDIAFAVGVLALLGKRVPPALRVLLLALAIIDDIGSILVIALFYSGPIALGGLGVAVVGVLVVVLLQRLGVRRPSLYVVPGVIVWAGIWQSGIHPTIAGVLVGLLTPARAWLGPKGLVAVVRRSAEQVEHELGTGELGAVSPERLAEEAARIDLASREALSPATRIQLALHPWVAFGIMPLFALANAGVTLDRSAMTVSSLSAGIVLGLVLGKPIGILAACALFVRTRIASLPRGIGWRELVVLGTVAGIGFTMALFVAALAFRDGVKLELSKAAILAGSTVAIVLGYGAGRLLLRPEPAEDAAADEHAAETSDEL